MISKFVRSCVKVITLLELLITLNALLPLTPIDLLNTPSLKLEMVHSKSLLDSFPINQGFFITSSVLIMPFELNVKEGGDESKLFF